MGLLNDTPSKQTFTAICIDCCSSGALSHASTQLATDTETDVEQEVFSAANAAEPTALQTASPAAADCSTRRHTLSATVAQKAGEPSAATAALGTISHCVMLSTLPPVATDDDLDIVMTQQRDT
jgi:hypothetical protein